MLSAVLLPSLLCACALPVSAEEDSGSECTSLMEVLQQQDGHKLFALALEATGFEFDSQRRYTVLLPSDGPDNAQAADGTEGFGGFLKSFDYDTSSASALASHDDIDNLGSILKQMILPGALSAADLRRMATSNGGKNDVRTLFNTEEDAGACEHVGNDMHDSHFGEHSESMATADGDVRVAMSGRQLAIIDDSDFTAPANITATNIPACGGSLVHLMNGWLSPCCLGDGDGQCAQARLSRLQRGDAVVADETAASHVAPRNGVWAAAVVVLTAALLVC